MTRYPFSPELLDALPEELAILFRSLENKLLEEICSRLNISGQLNEVTVQDILALRSHGIDLRDIEKAIRETAGISEKKLNQLLDDVVQRNQKYYTELIDLARVTAPEVLVDEVTIEAIRRQTLGEFRNITQSMGFLVDHGRTMLPPAKAYQWALDNAEMQIQSGAISYNQAIATAVKDLADGGLCVAYDTAGNPIKNMVQYAPKQAGKRGHREHLDVAVRRAVMTGVNQLNAQYREQSMEYLGTDLVETTAHRGARNIDGPMGWENHEKWQGKIYRWNKHGEYSEYSNASDDHDGRSLKTEHYSDKKSIDANYESASTIAEDGNSSPLQKKLQNVISKDVTAEYLDSATPGEGTITYDKGYKKGGHQQETNMAEWLHKTFGGDIRLLKEANIDKVRTPDYMWRGKLWDLKTTTSEKAADSAIRHGLKQIISNPGGIILDYRKSKVSVMELKKVVDSRMRHCTLNNVGIMAVFPEGKVVIWEYKK